ncbi:hypothetical protein COCMIDRAFT_107634, partial [Bipolaris oryzae ATCC 44560]
WVAVETLRRVWIADLSGTNKGGKRLFKCCLDILGTPIYHWSFSTHFSTVTIVEFLYNLNSL